MTLRTSFRHGRLSTAVTAALALFVLGSIALLASATGWEETWMALRAVPAGGIAVLLALSLVNYFARAVRWHIFARRMSIPTSFATNLLHFLAGLAMAVTPARAGELVRMAWLRRETGVAVEKTAPLFLADRATDLGAMAGLLAALALAGAGGGPGALVAAILAGLAAWVALQPAVLRGVARAGYHAASGRAGRLFARVSRSARALARIATGPALAIGLGLGALGWFAEALAFHLLLVWMGADIGLAAAAAIFLFATLAGGATGAPGGLGGAEAAMVALLALADVPLEIALPATLVIRLTTLWFAIVIGALLFPLAERRSRRHALENG